VPLWGLSGSVTIGPRKVLAQQFATESSILRSGFVKLGLAAIKMVMMICAGELGCRLFVFGRGMFAGRRVGGMHGARVGAVVCQTVTMTRHRAARTVRRAATAQSCARATSTHMSAAAAATTTVSAAATATAAATMSTATATATTAAAAGA
jgi:hypothetical protein